MSRKERRPDRSARLGALLERGDWGRARADGRAILADPAASEAERAAASEALRRLAPEPGALAVGAAGAAAFVLAAALGLFLR